MNDGQHVLVVDELTETQEVLQAVLAPRGFIVERAAHSAPLTAHELQSRPDVVVIDADSLPAQQTSSARWRGVPQVIIGAARVPDSPLAAASQRHLAKPFQFPELIQAVEQLLAAARRD